MKNICISSWKSTDWSQRFHYKPKRWNTVSGLLRSPPKQKPGRYGMQGWSNPPASVSRMGLGGGESREEIARVHSLCPGHAAAQLHSISLLQLIWLAVVGQRYVNQSKWHASIGYFIAGDQWLDYWPVCGPWHDFHCSREPKSQWLQELPLEGVILSRHISNSKFLCVRAQERQ